jgi:hypothetical protein
MSAFDKVRLWWWRRGLHGECIEWQTLLWHGIDAPLGARIKCMQKMVKLREFFTPSARLVR